VQGRPCGVGPNGAFATDVTVREGVAAITLTAVDLAGNRTDRSLAVETGDYLPAGTLAAQGLAGRINQGGLAVIQTFGGAAIARELPALTASLQAANPIYSNQFTLVPGVCIASVDASIDSLSFGTPALAVGSSTAGVDFQLDIPNLSIEVTATDSCGIPYDVTGGFTADNAHIHAVAQLGIGAGNALDVSFPIVDVSFTNFSFNLAGGLSWVAPLAEGIVESKLESAFSDIVRTDGATAIRQIVAQQAQIVVAGAPATFSYGLDGISTDANGIAFTCGIDLALTPDPSFPASPGSLVTTGGVPAFSTTEPIVASLSDEALNLLFHETWRAGLLATTIEPGQLAQQFGVALPFGATASDLVQFFPQLAGIVPAQLAGAPLVFKISSLLPPTARLEQNVPDPLRLSFGEYHLTASIDQGGGQLLDVFTVSMQAEIQLGLAIQNGTVAPIMTTLPDPIFYVDLIDEPLVKLGAEHIQGYLGAVVPLLMGGIVGQLPPIPLPTLPAGVQLVSATLAADGPQGTYLTIDLDLR
jgi:hypothetical protein